MTYDELIDELISRTAIIVHCSRVGQGDKTLGDDIYPDDLKKAIHVAQSDSGLSCSLIWPQHRETWGQVGLIMRPLSTASVSEISVEDAGSFIQPQTGKRRGSGNPFSGGEVQRTFEQANGYNEWIIEQSEPVGVFVQPLKWLYVSAICEYDDDLAQMMGTKEHIGQKNITIPEIASDFASLPIYTLNDSSLLRIRVSQNQCVPELASITDIYGR